jgi:hypothetical protein
MKDTIHWREPEYRALERIKERTTIVVLSLGGRESVDAKEVGDLTGD